ncbi:MAG: M14 family zinc carboxypeptidase [Pirellulales bacterium]
MFDVDDAGELVDRLAAEHKYVTKFELAKSREGRAVPALVVDEKPEGGDDASRLGIWIQARQHAWESGGSWVGVGFIEWLTSDDPRAVALRKQATIYFVPVMDVDSVATGNGGKNQTPQDHNRDWSAKPHFPEVAAAQKRIAELDKAGRFDLFVDLHNPAPSDGQPFFFVSPDEELSPTVRRNIGAFVAAAKEEIVGPLKLSPNTRPSGANYSPQWQAISKNWVTANCRPHVVSVTLETSWNTAHSTTAGYTTVGRQLGLAIEKYFRTSPRIAVAQ